MVSQTALFFSASAGSNYVIRFDGGADESWLFLQEWGAPSNDNFANRTALDGTSIALSGPAFGSTHEPGEPLHAGTLGTGSVWWSWQAPATGCLTLSALSGFSPIWGVYLGETITNLTPVSSAAQTTLRLRVTQGSLYQIAVDSLGWASLNPGWNLSFGFGPLNDDFANATVLTGDMPVVSNLVVHATIEPEEPLLSSDPSLGSVWYSWTALASGVVTLSTSSGNPGCMVGVFTGNDLTNLTAVGSGSQGFSFLCIAGTCYKVAVQTADLSTDATVVLRLGFLPSPPNDNFAVRTSLTGMSVTMSGTVSNASAETGEPAHGSNASGHSVWYSWKAPTGGLVSISATGDGWIPALAAYTGNSVADLNAVQQGSGAISFLTQAGTIYQLAVDGPVNPPSLFNLSLTFRSFPTNDNFSDRIVLVGFKPRGGGLLCGATGEPGEPTHAGVVATHSLWWTWTAPGDGQARIRVSSPQSSGRQPLSGQNAVYTGLELTNLIEVASSEMTGLVFRAVAGQVYQIAFNMDAPTFDPLDFTIELPKAPIVGPTNGQRFLEPASIDIVTQPIETDGLVRRVDFFVDANRLASVTNAPFRVAWTNVAAGHYSLVTWATDEFGEVTMSESVEVSVVPPNDDFVNRAEIPPTPCSVTGNLTFATQEAGEPIVPTGAGKTLWWSWTAPAKGKLTISTGGSAFTVYSGSELTNLTLLASNIFYYTSGYPWLTSGRWYALPDLTIPVQSAESFRISVDGLNGVAGMAVLSFDFVPDPPRPANDDFANRSLLLGSSVSVSGTTVSATHEAGEPNNGVPAGQFGSTVWWSWTATASGTVNLACDQNSVSLAVYAGKSLADLVFLAGGQFQTAFSALAGVEYQIVVLTGIESQTSFNLSLEGPAPPPRLVSINLDPVADGQLHIHVRGETGQAFALQASTNLLDWVTIATDTVLGQNADLVREDAVLYPRRFYRTLPLEAVVSPQLLNVSLVSGRLGRLISLRIAGAAGQPFIVRASTDLLNWVEIYHGWVIGGAVEYLDQNSGNYPARFYQAAPP
jgi:hypothetical protein